VPHVARVNDSDDAPDLRAEVAELRKEVGELRAQLAEFRKQFE